MPPATIARPDDVPEGYVHQSVLTDRGWTRDLIREHLASSSIRTTSNVSAHISPAWYPLTAIETAEASATYQTHQEQVAAAAAAAERKAASDAKRRDTLAARKAAAADLDRIIARDAHYPEQCDWLTAVKPGLLRTAITTPIWLYGPSGAYGVLTPAADRKVGDPIVVTLKDASTAEKEITRITKLGAREGILWILAAVENAAVMAQRRARAEAERAAETQRAAHEDIARAAARAAATAQAARAAQIAREEQLRIDKTDTAAIRTEVTARASEQIAKILGMGAPIETTATVTNAVDVSVAAATDDLLRLTAVELATAARLAQPCRPRMLTDALAMADDAHTALKLIATGRLDLTVAGRRDRVRVDARFVDVGGHWMVLSRADKVIQGVVTVMVWATSTTSKIVVDEAIPLGERRGDRLVLIRRYHDADR